MQCFKIYMGSKSVMHLWERLLSVACIVIRLREIMVSSFSAKDTSKNKNFWFYVCYREMDNNFDVLKPFQNGEKNALLSLSPPFPPTLPQPSPANLPIVRSGKTWPIVGCNASLYFDFVTEGHSMPVWKKQKTGQHCMAWIYNYFL